MPSKDTKRRSVTAAATLAPVLRRQVADVRARENDVRERQPDAVHLVLDSGVTAGADWTAVRQALRAVDRTSLRAWLR